MIVMVSAATISIFPKYRIPVRLHPTKPTQQMNPMLQRLFLLPLFAMVVMLAVPYSDVAYAGQTNIHRGDTVILIAPMSDGVTYRVQTPGGMEIWKDRDLHHFAANQEMCRVISSNGSEVLLFVPIMNARYWFTVVDR